MRPNHGLRVRTGKETADRQLTNVQRRATCVPISSPAGRDVGEHLRVFAEGKTALVADRELSCGKRPVDEDRLDVQQAFSDLVVGSRVGTRLTLRAGGGQSSTQPIDRWLGSLGTVGATFFVLSAEKGESEWMHPGCAAGSVRAVDNQQNAAPTPRRRM